ncbi:hypothetical protein AGABI1DRAFT_114182 [Agaricus bisporus var. burnettii JB137-S8]|uniref:BTB domain-containing protein n=2 Tax=Agaricus bisporus var. burnettii TaxID=192524 RepID=K5X9K7_AGABU|nr:uncharacterized protein AGABI1DRAFT_114182 [Agaricus bisporus var. burnettii JB137-S8]EKM79702.1 hypothetical protein AGABI1DRAFT_114182 [Agaricus bisporus var. burnettii JB137-S8]KAF7768390.1 hypothetical protein Agabi119p4_7633 [Agaricus bisporus var. burnettii]
MPPFNTETRPPPPTAVTRHHEYYIFSGDLFFLAREKVYFRVHSHFFHKFSGYWRSHMAGPVSPGDNRRPAGFHESTAFLIDLDPDDFALFLLVFYNPKYDLYNLTLDEWNTLLRLATEWDCPKIREMVFSRIDKMPALDVISKIKLYTQYKAPHSYLLPLCFQLAVRDRMPGREEFRLFDYDTFYNIFTAREMLRTPLASTSQGTPVNLTPDEKFDIVAVAFGLHPQEIATLRTSVVPLIVEASQPSSLPRNRGGIPKN